MTLSTQFWVNFSGSTSAQYPTDGAGGVTTTQASSAFASGNKWAGKAARLVGVEINDRPAGAGTVAIKDHAGTATYKTIGTGTAALYSDESNYTRCGLGGIVIPVGGISIVASDTGIGGTAYFEIEVIP
jgi:hypothetical protein